jgi:hypothetical protein
VVGPELGVVDDGGMKWGWKCAALHDGQSQLGREEIKRQRKRGEKGGYTYP